MGDGDDYLSISGDIKDTVDGGSSGTDYLHLASYSYDDYINDTGDIRTEHIEDFEYIMFSDGTVYSVDDNEITEDETVLSIFENGTANTPASNYYTVTGTATGGFITEGDSVTLEVNGTTYFAMVASDNTWTVDVSESDFNADHDFDIVVTSSDLNGNIVVTETPYVYSNATDDADSVQTAFEAMTTNIDENVTWFESNAGSADGSVETVDQNLKTLVDGDESSSISGTGNNDSVYGNGGDDYIVGNNSQDELHGGEGRDWLEGGDGDDELYGNDGDDLLSGGTAQDDLFGGAGNDILIGGSGDDSLSGEDGSDTMIGGLGHDTLFGGSGDDIIVGGLGNDQLYGGDQSNLSNGADSFVWLANDSGVDHVYGFDNNDSLDLSDLLQNETSDNLSNYFDFEYSDGDTIISVYAEGDKGEAGSSVTQTIVLDDVRLEGIDTSGNFNVDSVVRGLYNADDGSTNALIIGDTVIDNSNSTFEDDII